MYESIRFFVDVGTIFFSFFSKVQKNSTHLCVVINWSHRAVWTLTTSGPRSVKGLMISDLSCRSSSCISSSLLCCFCAPLRPWLLSHRASGIFINLSSNLHENDENKVSKYLDRSVNLRAQALGTLVRELLLLLRHLLQQTVGRNLYRARGSPSLKLTGQVLV